MRCVADYTEPGARAPDAAHNSRNLSHIRRTSTNPRVHLWTSKSAAKISVNARRYGPKCWCGRGDLNPHETKSHRLLRPARLPIPPLPQVREGSAGQPNAQVYPTKLGGASGDVGANRAGPVTYTQV